MPPSPAAAAPERILVVGDSQAQGLAGGLRALFRRDRSRRILDNSRISTGLLSRPDYDWPQEIVGIAASEHADVAVVMFGANDRPNRRTDLPANAGYAASFRQAYTKHARAIVDALNAAHTPVIWVGHPITRDPGFASDMVFLNGIYAQVAHDSGATFMPTWDAFLGPDGKYIAYGPSIDGLTTRLRADDGVHFTPSGYAVVAKMLVPLLDQHRPGPSPPHVGGATPGGSAASPPPAQPAPNATQPPPERPALVLPPPGSAPAPAASMRPAAPIRSVPAASPPPG